MLDQDFLTVTYDGDTSVYKVVVNNNTEEFTRDKNFYTFKMKATMGDSVDTFEYHVTSENGNIPCIVLGGDANAGNPWGCPFFSSWGSTQSTLSAYSAMDDNFDIVLYSHTGTAFESLRLFGGRILSTITPSEVGTNNILIEIEADFPILMGEPELAGSDPNYVEYRPTQDNDLISDCYDICNNDDWSNIDKAINAFDEADTIPRDNRYYINNIVRKNGSIVEQKRYEFRIGPTSKIGLVANMPHEPEGLTSNMILKITSPVFVYREGGTGDDWTVAHIVLSPFKDYYRGEWTDYSNGDFYKATTDTNIPIWKSNQEWGAYVDGELTEDDAENGGDLGHKHPTTGDDLDSSDIASPQIGASGVGANVWALSKSDLEDIFDILYNEDQTLIDDIKDGIWLWGNNPMDFIISIYYVPLDVSDFYSVSSGNSLYFGSYNSGLNKPKVVENKASNRIVLCNTPIESVYGDYRDITQFKYELFLPYIGFIPLSINAFLDKMLKVEMAFDVMTHNIRYYIYANGIIQERVDGSVGYDIPLMGTDQVNKAKSDIQGVKDIIDTTGKIAKSFAAPKPSDIITSVNGCISTYQNLASKPTAKILGGISSCMNIYDIKYVYLKITETGTIKPGNLNAIYNYPSYYIGNSAALSGYCELQDIQLSCAATDEEIAEIKSLLKGGVIF